MFASFYKLCDYVIMRNLNRLRLPGFIKDESTLSPDAKRYRDLDIATRSIDLKGIEDLITIAGQKDKIKFIDGGTDLISFINEFIESESLKFAPILFKQHDIEGKSSHKSCLVLVKQDDDKTNLIISDCVSSKKFHEIQEFKYILTNSSITDKIAKIYLNFYTRILNIGCIGFALRDSIYYARKGLAETKEILESFEKELKIKDPILETHYGSKTQIIFYDFVPELMYDSQFTKKQHENCKKSLESYIERNREHLSKSELETLEKLSKRESNSSNDRYVEKLAELASRLYSVDPDSESYRLYSKDGGNTYSTYKVSDELKFGRNTKIMTTSCSPSFLDKLDHTTDPQKSNSR